jgi:hypothetical protein
MGEEPPTPLSCAATSKRSSRCSPLRRRSTVGGRDVGESEFARELNRHIRAVAEQLGAGGELPVTVVCECGCMSRVTATLPAYEAADGIWLDAHRSA